MGALSDEIIETVDGVRHALLSLPIDDRIDCLNRLRAILHEVSPFKDNPVDLVQWVKAEEVEANDYNPNTVAPPEMRLLELSIEADGYTQPIVTHPEEARRIVVDGYHRNRVARENLAISAALHGYLPIVSIRPKQGDVDSRMASTIRHNRARGKHGVEAMGNIVTYLAQKNWSNEKIARELGMDADEVLRHRQISGLAVAFADREFSEAWEPSH